MTCQLLTGEEIARYLKVALVTVRIWTRRGGMPHLRMGRLIRYREEDVVAWLERGGPGLRDPAVPVRRLSDA
jgi:excisionase family DNA binding protein